MSEGYVFGQAWERERERLSAVESYWDPRSRTHLSELGVRDGWRCLDVGAGAGSLACWLAAEVAPTGSVLAVDLDARFLRELDQPGLAVQELDILRDPLPSRAFDLVHARLVLEHIPQRDEALRLLVDAVCPGGWIAITGQTGWDQWTPEPDDGSFVAARNALRNAVEAAGWDTEYMLSVPSHLSSLGLQNVSAEGWRRKEPGGRAGWPHVGWWAFERLGPSMIEAGALTPDEVAEAQRVLLDPTVMHGSCETWTVRGQRPLDR